MVPHVYIGLSGVPTPPVFAHCSGSFVNGTEAQRRVSGRTIELEMSVLLFGVFLRAIRISPVKRLMFGRSLDERNRQGVLNCVIMEMIKEWLQYSIMN